LEAKKSGRRVKSETANAQIASKTRILLCATRLFQEKGYTGVAIRDVTTAADVTASTVYHYFKDKKGLFVAIVLATLENILEDLNKASYASGFEMQLTELLAVFYRHRHSGIGNMLHEMTIHQDFEVADLQEVGLLVNQQWRNLVEKLVKEAVQHEELRPGNNTYYTQVIIEMGFSLARSPLGNWTGWSEERQIAEATKLLLNGFAAKKASSSI